MHANLPILLVTWTYITAITFNIRSQIITLTSLSIALCIVGTFITRQVLQHQQSRPSRIINAYAVTTR